MPAYFNYTGLPADGLKTFLSSPHTLAAASAGQLYGSQGGDGSCSWSSTYTYTIDTTGTLSIVASLTLSTTGYALSSFLVNYSNPANHTLYDALGNVIHEYTGFDCKIGNTFTFKNIGGLPSIQNQFATTPGRQIYYDGTTVSVTPSAGATWQQCGQNSDGTTYEAPPPVMGMPNFKATIPANGKTISLLTVPRPERCESYNGRDEFRPGCNGWLCAGKCAKGIKAAMPGLFCQTCESYDVDLDFIGQGPEGWFK